MSTVTALAKAAAINRIYDTISFSGAVAAGAVHAVEAGFGGKGQPKALKSYQRSLLNEAKKLVSKGEDKTAKDADTLLSGFGGLGKAEKRRGRDKDNT